MAPFFAALLCSLLLALSSPGMGVPYFAWIAVVPLLHIANTNIPKRAFMLGFIAGIPFYTFLLSWVTISLGTYGHLPVWITYPALFLLACYMSLYLALFCLFVSLTKKTGPILTAPFIWVGLDFIRGFLFTGFPWQDLGYTQYNFPLLIQIADLAGHHGVTFLLVLANSLIYSAVIRPRFYTLVYAMLVITAAISYSFYRLNSIEEQARSVQTLSVAIIQPNIAQDQKWLPQTRQIAINTHIDLSSQAASQQSTDLVIWPETAIPLLGTDTTEFPEISNHTVKKYSYSLLSGIPYATVSDGKRTLYNSAILFNPDGARNVYHKKHLVPFGEYIPFTDIIPFLAPLVEAVGNFSSGSQSQPLSSPKAGIGVLICFESIFPELARTLANNGAKLLVNITNDAWFGRSNASIQHMSMAVFRAVENRRSLARSANTGISCFITPTGRILQPTPLFTQCFITSQLPLYDQKSFFGKWGYHFPHLCFLILILSALFSISRRNKTY